MIDTWIEFLCQWLWKVGPIIVDLLWEAVMNVRIGNAPQLAYAA